MTPRREPRPSSGIGSVRLVGAPIVEVFGCPGEDPETHALVPAAAVSATPDPPHHEERP